MLRGRRSYQPRVLNPVKMLFKNEGEINTFPDKPNWDRKKITPHGNLHSQEGMKSTRDVNM